MINALFYIGGTVVLLTVIGILVLLYHKHAQEMWEDVVRSENDERYRRDFARRWRNQDVRVHAQMVIIDEMNRRKA